MDDKQDRILVLGATGRVGRHVVGELVRRLAKEPSDGPTIIYAATRDPTSAPAQSLLQLTPPSSPDAHGRGVSVDLLPLDLAEASDAELGAACRDKPFIFLSMPQPFSPPQMLACQQRLAAVLARIEPKPRFLVKLSSFGIDERSSKFVMVRGVDKTQGPLGDAHREGEAALCAAGIPWLVSLRPSSFFANFDAYDLPALLAGERVVRSPLGPTARVNWIACEDVGAAGAAVLMRALFLLRRNDASASSPVESIVDWPQQPRFEAIDVLGPRANTLSGPGLAVLVTRALQQSQSQPQSPQKEGQALVQGQEGQQPLPKSQSASDGGGGQGQALAPACRYEEVPVPPDEAYGGLWRFLRAGGFDAWAADDHVLWREWVGRAPRGMEAHVLGVLSEGMTGRI